MQFLAVCDDRVAVKQYSRGSCWNQVVVSLTTRFQNGYTPLHIAAKKNQMDIGTTLLEYGADTNAVTRQGISPIHLAAQEGSVDLVSLLLAKHANVNVCNKVRARAEVSLRC